MQRVVDFGECRAQIDRLRESETLRHSASLKKLIVYLADASLTGKAHELKEYTVGIEALSKPSDYDPRTDSSVRVLAGKLRQKLDVYYSGEGAQDPIKVQFPKGHFELEFAHQAPAGPKANTAASSLLGSMRFWRVAALLLFAALVAVALSAAWRLEQRAAPALPPSPYPSPEFEAFWAPLIESREPLVVVLGSPLFVRLGHDYLRIPSINRWRDFEGHPRKQELEERFAVEQSFPRYIYTGIGEATGAFLLAKQFTPVKADFRVERSALLSWDEIRAHNVIFLGSVKFNPQMKDLPVPLDFLDEGAITNSRPQPGERQSYDRKAILGPGNILEEYALITRIRGLTGWQ
ncbi:MAG: hypothetical protein GY953_32725, partial [bacterium]|nr:hypothetical protein [bacterium]